MTFPNGTKIEGGSAKKVFLVGGEDEQVIGNVGARSIPVNTAHLSVPAGNTASVITLPAAGIDVHNVVSELFWSYSAAPAGGRITIQDGIGSFVFDLDIIAGGPDSISFKRPKRGTANTAMIITLAAAGGVIVGKLNITAYLE